MTMLTDPRDRLPRRWGRSRERSVAGLSLICVGVAATSLSSTYSLWFLAIGPVMQAAGWLLLPGALWRRLLVLIPCLLAGVILLGGVDFVGAFAVLLGGWLVVRHRPAATYLVVLLPIAASFVIKVTLQHYGQNPLALFIGTLATVAGAWLAAWLHGRLIERRGVVFVPLKSG
ncbi:hypothetical protein [Cryobacterium roopkundense]|uniref:Lysylphosphatidylglycerol synthetase-like protein (DUF2156 family) n=1 Tax=Cryobacterium roopkundense TaxID=1001240 RepID=A0A7W8ZSY9_9MICO|nr:hypothetical protein [Cryobacterium roopkundense]MBB5639619.1 lysylphosphatidylglycerol synthetase-like protein (DUF2156 family) [Cryobacterium roopkundense]